MSKFKVGDKVKILCSRDKDIRQINNMIGKVSTIVRITDSNRYRVACLTFPDDGWYFYEYELELVNEEKSTEKTLGDQLKEAETLVSELKAKLEHEKNFVDKYEYEFYAGSCKPILHKGGVPFNAATGLGIRCWSGIKTDQCNVKYKLTLERIKE